MEKIGITERGDAGLDLTWTTKMDQVDGAVIISKSLRNAAFLIRLLQYQDKIVLHHTITGYGGTIVEPNVASWQQEIQRLLEFTGGPAAFPKERVVVRIDPIIPTAKGIALADSVAREAYRIGVRRIRISVLDMYPHVRARFAWAELRDPYNGNFQASDKQFAAVDAWLEELLQDCPGLSVECCAEPKLIVPEKTGCVGIKEYQMFGLTIPETSGCKQRQNCLCLPGKTELLSNKRQCAHGCLYCYWKTEKGDTV